ncbi:MAG TPA: TetM/TetW/TetO/TetS family tetracycline resistance ribosomal protection protein [Clostridiales bacterium]|nr:TetM/TetW/TetO/TetS family tetracycline resistance ribosomal protection protein [Clostridiales bacterium]
MKKTIGIFAHVDAGKTTFSEQLLYYTGSIRNIGRVDYKTSCMDTNEIEQKRGITIFADQGIFTFEGDTYYLIDTPGHVDFSSETERAICALDYAIMLISGSSGVQAHTTTLFRLLKSYRIPTFFFINKTDIDGFNMKSIIEDIKNKLTDDILYFNSIKDILKTGYKEAEATPEAAPNATPEAAPDAERTAELVAEFAAERDEEFMEAYLQGDYTVDSLQEAIIGLIRKQECFPVMSGSALKGSGIATFLETFSKLSSTFYEGAAERKPSFAGNVYKIRHDEKGNRLTFIKALEGKLKVKDEFTFEKSGGTYVEKVNEIRIYNGKKYDNKNVVSAGEVFAVTGLKTPVCGTTLETGKITVRAGKNYYLVPALQSKINILDETDITTCIEKLRILESEDPMLSVSFQKESGQILVSVMGKIQLEVLEQLIATRFGISITFEKPQVQYRETIGASTVGYGHFEPLRHYAEVHLRLEPNPRGDGIIFASECHVDTLTLNYQRSIEIHVFEKPHKGVLTGSPITDVRIVLQNGRAHLKHTEGGDFREAVYRAIRQGLEKAESILLEPFYRFEIYAEAAYLGRIMSDIERMRGTYESPIQTGENVYIRGRGPVETFMEYSVDLVAFTKGNGSISFMFDGYDVCQNADEVIKKIRYDKNKDVENTSSSVFCAKGTSFIIPWDKAENYMHIPL